MDFLKDMEDYRASMENAYILVTKRKTLDDINEMIEDGRVMEFYLPFHPLDEDGRDPSTIALLISYFTETEEYEKCQELLDLKKRYLEAPQT